MKITYKDVLWDHDRDIDSTASGKELQILANALKYPYYMNKGYVKDARNGEPVITQSELEE